MSALGRLWGEVLSRQPLPRPEEVLLTGLVALGLVLAPATWPWVRLGVTTVHEGGHALVAVLVGRRLSGIHLRPDSSGLTLSRGRPRGPGMVAMLAAGYLAPALLGLVATALLLAHHPLALLWLLVALTLVMVLWIRNGYGALLLVVLAGGLGAFTWWAEPRWQTLAATLITWVLLLAAPRPVLELARRRGRASDADQLARLTPLPAGVWIVVMLAANLAGLVLGATRLLPSLP